ncbi:MAG: hypothetical protein E6G19_08150 [Actinobacteria bacterium]|nr:MAG: hypothetical protein E6G19_08150 [Actinomycetota bacterium]
MKLATAAAATALLFAAGFVATGAANDSSKKPGGKKGHQNTTPATTGSPTTTTATPSTTTTATPSTSTSTTTSTAPAPAPPPPPSAPAPGSVLFRGDYDGGSFSQWAGHQWSRNNDQGYTCADLGDSGANVVQSPRAQGGYAADFTVYSSTQCTSSPRSEVYASVADTGGYEGQEWYYGWWTMFPVSDAGRFLTSTGDWNVFTQFHAPGSCGAQDYFGVDATSIPKLYLEIEQSSAGLCHGDLPSLKRTLVSPLVFGQWYHFIAHFKWSTDRNVGSVQIFVNGLEVVPMTSIATLAPVSNPSAYWKQGFYGMDMSNGLGNGVYQDGACRADSYAAADAC